MKSGERWVSKTQPDRGFTIDDVAKDGSITVTVERVVAKDGRSKLEKHRRSIARNDFSTFALGYQKAKET